MVDDDIDFTVTDSRVADDDIDFNVTDSRVVDNESDIDFAITDSRVDDSDIYFNITHSKVITNQNSRVAAKTISGKYKNIRQKKAAKLLKLAALKDKNKNVPVFKKSAILVAKKISDKYKRLRKHKNVDLVADVQETLTNNQISQKYKKMRSKRAPIPFNLATLAETDNVTYSNNTNLEEVSSSKNEAIAAKKISQKHKNMRNKRQTLPFNLSDIADADFVDYNGDTNLQDANMNKNAILTSKKIIDKYRNVRRKRKGAKSPEPIEDKIKRPKTSSILRKSARIAAKKISDKYKRLRYGR